MSQMSISGAVSGMDTATMIDQLMRIEATQQTMISQRKAAAQKTADAYGTLTTSLKGIADKATDLAKTSAWAGATATSSSTSVTAAVTGTMSASFTFDVTAVAAAHTVISASTVGAATAVVASGPITITRGDGTELDPIDVGTGSLRDVVAAINSSDAGLRAAAVQTSPGVYRLQVTAADTGADSQFTIAGLDGFTGLDVLTAGKDAAIKVGTNPATAYTVTSSSNTFSDLVPGLSFTVSKQETGVTVSTKVDGTAVADQVSALVDKVNDVLSSMSSQTSWNATTKTGGPLLGESAVRSLQQQILSTVGFASAPGVELTRDGKLKFDKDAFTKAFAADPDSVARAYGASAALTPTSGINASASLVRSGAQTRPGSYPVHVTTAAAREQWQLDPPGGDISNQTIIVTRGSTVASYTAGNGESLADAVAAINARMAKAGLGIGAVVDSGSIVLTAVNAGAGPSFSTSLGAVDGTRLVTGQDIAGTIDGHAATGSGEVLSLAKGNGPASGLAVRISADDDAVSDSGGDIGDVTYSAGLAQKLVSLIGDATDSDTGSLAVAEAGRESDVKDLQEQIEAWTLRLDLRRTTLQRQFTAMETALASLKSQTSALGGLLTSS